MKQTDLDCYLGMARSFKRHFRNMFYKYYELHMKVEMFTRKHPEYAAMFERDLCKQIPEMFPNEVAKRHVLRDVAIKNGEPVTVVEEIEFLIP